MGDEWIYEKIVVLWVVNFCDGMIVEWSCFLYDFLVMVLSEIINNVKGINCVVYDISIKLFFIIEWEQNVDCFFFGVYCFFLCFILES